MNRMAFIQNTDLKHTGKKKRSVFWVIVSVIPPLKHIRKDSDLDSCQTIHIRRVGVKEEEEVSWSSLTRKTIPDISTHVFFSGR